MQDIALVPISVSYDRPAEEGALVTELSGIPKEKESLASLLAAAGSLAVGGSGRKSKRGREAIGADIMRVGEIVTLERFLAVRSTVQQRPCALSACEQQAQRVTLHAWTIAVQRAP